MGRVHKLELIVAIRICEQNAQEKKERVFAKRDEPKMQRTSKCETCTNLRISTGTMVRVSAYPVGAKWKNKIEMKLVLVSG